MGVDSRLASNEVSRYCLPLERVVRINQGVVAKTGEPHLVRCPAYILGALGRPLQTFFGDPLYTTVVARTGALIHGLATSHGFEQGNKRTSFIVGTVYLEHNDFELRDMTEEEAGQPVVDLVEGKISQNEYTLWIAENLK